MQITTSYATELKKLSFSFKDTIKIYREALAFCIDVCDKEWDSIIAIEDELKQKTFVENLIHSTKNNVAKYNFDEQFPKFPSYLRRDVRNKAIGKVLSYRSNLANWEKSKKGNKPRLSLEHNEMPVFYKDNMYLTSDNPYECKVKVYINNDWVWRNVSMLSTDVKYIQKHKADAKRSAPTLEKRYGKYYLRFAFTESTTLSDTRVANQKICSVDLGLNTDAVCSIMTADGTIHARKFIDFPCEKDQLYRVLNRIKKHQRKYGSQSVSKRWSYAQYLNDELSAKIASAIVEFASYYNCDVIVFEYLDIKGKKKGRKAQKIAMWRKNGIQKIASCKAHLKGIRISHVCAWNTSKLAFDGTGEVIRDDNNKANATFRSGKRYNADLNASYNIGARYYIRELLKPLRETERSQVLAKVPETERRTTCTYSTLLKLNKAFKSLNLVM